MGILYRSSRQIHVWMWELDYEESWVLKNWCFELRCGRRLLRVPWTARRSNQSILKISPGCSLEGMMLKLKLQYFGHLIGKDWFWEGLGAGGEGDDRGWDGWMASPTRWTWVWVNSGRWRWTGRPGVLRFMGSQRVGHDWVTELRQIYRDVSLEIWMIEGSSNLEEKHPSLREYRVQKPWISRTSLSVPRIQRHQQVLERNEVC